MPSNIDRHWLLTWTTYGTWLPGDVRGYVSPTPQKVGPRTIRNQPGTPYDRNTTSLERAARKQLKSKPIFLCHEHADPLAEQFLETADHRGWKTIALAIMRAHVHLFVGVPGDPEPDALLRDFKSYGSRTLNRRFGRPKSGTWWTEGGSKRIKRTEVAIIRAARYVAGQEKPLVVQVDRDWEWTLQGGKPPVERRGLTPPALLQFSGRLQ